MARAAGRGSGAAASAPLSPRPLPSPWGPYTFAVFPRPCSVAGTPRRRVYICVHGHLADASVLQHRYSHHGAFRTATRRLPRGYMRATRSVRVRRAVWMRLLGARATVSLLLLRLGRLVRARVHVGLRLGRVGRSRLASGASRFGTRVLRSPGSAGAVRGGTIF
jgi:hypothetical protein